MGEVFDRYADTVGNYHFTDTETGHHVIPRLDNNSTKVDNENVELVRKEDVIKMIQETNISSGMTKARLLIKAQDLPPAHEPRLAQKIWMIVRKITDSDGLQHEVVYYNDLKDVMYEVMRWMI